MVYGVGKKNSHALKDTLFSGRNRRDDRYFGQFFFSLYIRFENDFSSYFYGESSRQFIRHNINSAAFGNDVSGLRWRGKNVLDAAERWQADPSAEITSTTVVFHITVHIRINFRSLGRRVHLVAESECWRARTPEKRNDKRVNADGA